MKRRMVVLTLALLPALVLSSPARDVQTYGALRAMFHEGRTGAVVSLDSLLPDPQLYAVGALADLAGEITVLGGKAYLSYPAGPDTARTEVLDASGAAATLLVTASVREWKAVTVSEPIPFDRLDDAIAAAAKEAGVDTGARIPFRIDGEFRSLEWHVVDGSRLDGAGDSHEDHVAAGVRLKRDRTRAELIGFYSEGDQGVFTHVGSRTHIHCVLGNPVAAGHVDHFDIPAGATISFPGDE